MLRSLQAALRKGDLPKPGERAGVALSGGADSVAALVGLQDLAFSGGFHLTVLHVNYSLRGAESDADEAFAVDLARSLGLYIMINRPALPPGNRQQAAREARYAWFHELIRSGQLDKVAVGHTASDQAETVLFRFLRGSGTAGLAGIRPATGHGIIRPLLDLSREEIRAYLTARGIPWREDSSNADLRFARNRIRHELLPALTRDWNPALPRILSQTAEWARSEEEYWAAEVRRLAAHHLRFTGGSAIISAPEVLALPLAAARRLLRFAIEQIKGDLRGIDFPHVEQILALLSSAGADRIRIPGLDVQRSFEWVRFARPDPAAPAYGKPVEIPGRVQIPGGPALQFERKASDTVYNESGHQLDWDRVSGPLELRNWRPGDHYRRVGHSSEIKLKFLFQKFRVPAWERRTWPVITCNNSIVWARSFGPAAHAIRSPATHTVLLIREIPSEGEESSNQNV